MKIIIFKKSFESGVAWGNSASDNIEGEIEFCLFLEWRGIFWFVLNVPNKSFGGKNPFKVLSEAIESQSVGMGKYTRLKERVRSIDVWQQL